MRPLIFSLLSSCLAVAVLSAAPPKQTFTGTITDSMCGKADHSQMQMGPTNAACTLACVDVHGATYVLYDGKNAYTLSDQKTPEKFAGQINRLQTKKDSIPIAVRSGPAISPHPPQPPAATFNRLYRTRAEHLAHLHAFVITRLR